MATALGSYATAALIKARAGITDTTDDTLLGTIADQVNMWIEQTTGRVLAPVSGTPVLTYDGDGDSRLYLPRSADSTYPYPGGFRTVTKVEIADYTGAAYTELASTDYFLRGKSHPAAPFDWLYLSDRSSSGDYTFPRGFATVKVTGTIGWAAIPDDIIDVALTVAVRAWHARQSGQLDIVGTDEMGERLVSRFIAARDKQTLRAYTLPGDLA